MCRILALTALLASLGVPATAQVTYTFFDAERDETYEVYALVDGDELTGLATFNIELTGLEATPIDPTEIVFRSVQSELRNLRSPDFQLTGFTNPALSAGVIDLDTYRIAASQARDPSVVSIYGFAAVDTFVEAAGPSLSINGTLIEQSFGVVGVFLGELTIPNSEGFTDAELTSLFASTAEVFDGTNSSFGVVPATVSHLVVTVPEPPAGFLLLLFAVLRTARSRNGLSV